MNIITYNYLAIEKGNKGYKIKNSYGEWYFDKKKDALEYIGYLLSDEDGIKC